MSASDESFEGWAIVELMGHRRLAGYVSEVEIAGSGFVRLDIPGELAPDPNKATQFYSPGAVYCITPTTEEIARKIATSPTPVARWELEPARPAPWDEVEADALGEAPDEHSDAEWAELMEDDA